MICVGNKLKARECKITVFLVEKLHCALCLSLKVQLLHTPSCADLWTMPKHQSHVHPFMFAAFFKLYGVLLPKGITVEIELKDSTK